MKSATRAKWLLSGKNCENCFKSGQCKKNQAELLVCGSWEKIPDNPFDRFMFSTIKKTMPTMIASEMISIQPMAPPTGTIFNISPKYTDNEVEEIKFTMTPVIDPLTKNSK